MKTKIIFLIAIIIVVLSFNHIRKKEYDNLRKIVLPSIPIITLFFLIYLHALGVMSFPSSEPISLFPKIISIPMTWSLPLPLVNYMIGESLVDYNQSYLYLLNDVLSLYLASYLSLLPLILLGIRKIREKTAHFEPVVTTMLSTFTS